MTINVEFASVAEYTDFVRAIGAVVENLLADKPRERQEEVRGAIARAAEAYAAGDGTVGLPGEVICTLGHR